MSLSVERFGSLSSCSLFLTRVLDSSLKVTLVFRSMHFPVESHLLISSCLSTVLYVLSHLSLFSRETESRSLRSHSPFRTKIHQSFPVLFFPRFLPRSSFCCPSLSLSFPFGPFFLDPCSSSHPLFFSTSFVTKRDPPELLS